MTGTCVRQSNKEVVWEYWRQIDAADQCELPSVASRCLDEGVVWTGFHPFNELRGCDGVLNGWWLPLRTAFPDVRRDIYILLSGSYAGKDWVSATGYFSGTFAADWAGIPATGRPTCIRFGEFCAVANGRIVEDYLLLDMPDVMRQAGYRVLPLAPGEDYWPRPFCEESVLLSTQDNNVSARSLHLVDGMTGGLGWFDGEDAAKMNQITCWAQDMQWYGPVGIGSSRNRPEYRRNHQTPFVTAFPDRKGFTHPDGETYTARIAEGYFVASTGWPSVRATHLGEYLGVPSTGAQVEMREAAWWRREGDRLVQSWVFIDLPHLCLQMGVDLFERLRKQRH